MKLRREPVLGSGTRYGDCTVLPCGGTGQGDERSDRELIALRRGQQSQVIV